MRATIFYIIELTKPIINIKSYLNQKKKNKKKQKKRPIFIISMTFTEMHILLYTKKYFLFIPSKQHKHTSLKINQENKKKLYRRINPRE
jgi:hypothetical protein